MLNAENCVGMLTNSFVYVDSEQPLRCRLIEFMVLISIYFKKLFYLTPKGCSVKCILNTLPTKHPFLIMNQI